MKEAKGILTNVDQKGISRSLGRLVGRRLLSGGAWAIAGKVLSATTNVLVIALLARMLSAKELGAYFLLFSFASVGAVCAQLGLDQTVVRLVAGAMGAGNPGLARTAATVVLRWGALGALAVGVVLAVGAGRWLVELLFRSPLLTNVVKLVPLCVMAGALQNLIAETFRGFHDIRLASLFSRGASNLMCAILLSALWLWRHGSNLIQATVVSIVAGIATVFVAGYILQRKLRSLGTGEQMNSKEVLTSALPQLITNVTLITNSHAALWILGAFRPPEDTAIFGAAVRLVAFVNLPIVIVNSVVAPIIVELYAQRKQKELEATLRAIATVTGIPSVAVLLGYFAFGKLVLDITYGSYYEQGAVALTVLSIGQLASVCSGSCGLTLIMSGHQNTMMTITLTCGVFGVAVVLLLVKQYGVLGAAVASAATAVLQNLLMLLFVKRKTGVWTHARLSFVTKGIFAR